MAATFESIKLKSLQSLKLTRTTSSVVPVSQSFTWTLRVLCGAALGLTGYLAVTALRSEDVAGCGGGALFDCGFALNSRWSKLFAIPVSVPAFGLYALLLASLAVCRPAAPRSHLSLAWGTITVGAILAGLAAVWFVGLQVFAIGHLCAYCMLAHLCGLALCLAILWKQPYGIRTTAMLSCVSMFGASVLIGGQLLATPPATFRIEHHPIDAVRPISSVPASTDSDSERQGKGRVPEIFEPPEAIPSDTTENKQ
jgi:uncharacterized membrane protein